MIWTILADLAGLAASYGYGAILSAWVESCLLEPLRGDVTRLYERLVALLPLPPSLQSALSYNAGLSWLTIAVLIHLAYAVRYLCRRRLSSDLARAHAGVPGDHYWEAVERCFRDYREALERWEPRVTLKTPSWRYYKRLQTGEPDMAWRGRTLVIEKSLLEPDRLQELAPYLARELMYYNCEDVTIREVLNSYPDRLTCWLVLWNLLGLYVCLPVLLAKTYLWPSYWRERVMVADEYAYGLGQGGLLHFHIDMQVRQEEALREERREIAREIVRLEQQSRVFQAQASIGDWSLPGDDARTYSYESSYSSSGFQKQFNKTWNQLAARINELRKRDVQLGVQELAAHSVRPMLEERRGQLSARLRTEQRWMEQCGITPPPPIVPLPTAQELPRQLPRGAE
jgi:hypothetical protein